MIQDTAIDIQLGGEKISRLSWHTSAHHGCLPPHHYPEPLQPSSCPVFFNPLTPNNLYISRTTPLTSKRCILCIYSTNVGTEYLKHALYSPFFSLQNAVCFIMQTSLVPVLFTFYIQDVLKLKKNNSGTKWLTLH